MKGFSILAVGLLLTSAISAQVGIGTLTPNTKSVLELNSNSKGFLLPRMTSGERSGMGLSAADAGMMVFQTTSPKGIYMYDGAGWIYSAPIDNGSASSTTLRWDVGSNKWIAASNMFNGGGSIGINTGTSANYQLQLNSIGSSTKLQLTSSVFGTSTVDGLILGMNNNTVSSTAGQAYLLNQESKPLWFGTWNVERMRIDSVGHIGINTMSPNQLLHINGNASLPGQLQITNLATAALPTDGLLLGCTSLGLAQLMQQENNSLTFGTNGIERIRLDSIGRLGVNTSSPTAALDVNGSFKLGTNGSSLQSIMRMDYETDPPVIAAFAEWICDIPCPNTTTNAVVYVSPGITMEHIMVGYARISVAGNIQVKLMNMSSSPVDIGTVMLHIAVIQ